MSGGRTLARHADLVHRMAATVGADLPGAAAEGRISGEDLREAVVACTSCGNPEGCGTWLDDHHSGAAEAPDFCRNGALFAALKPEPER